MRGSGGIYCAIINHCQPKWGLKTNFLDWDNYLCNAMTDTKFSVDKYTCIIYLIRDDNNRVTDTNVQRNITAAEPQILQVPL